MRLNLNLASQKYEDVRRFYVRWGLALAILAIFVPLLAAFSYTRYSNSTASAQKTRDLQQQIAQRETERNQLVAEENRPENKETTQEKRFWNTQIARRSFSWTQLLNDMQKIMPRRAFLDSVQPELTQDGRLKLRLTITGEKRDDARELVVRMEDSTRFHHTLPLNETEMKETKPGLLPTYKFEIETYYTPTGPAFAQPPAQSHRSQASPRQSSAKEGL